MLIKNFQAESIQKALDQVKREFGSQAVIMKTDIVRERGQKLFSVTAARDGQAAASEKVAPESSPNRIVATVPELSPRNSALEAVVIDLLLPELLTADAQQLFAVLRDHDVDHQTALAIARRLHRDEGGERDILTLLSALTPDRAQLPASCERVAFVGPPGAGKSSVLAKFATRQVFSQGRKVQLTTLDNFRPTAEAEIANLADILGFVEERRKAATKDEQDQLLLVDTEGVAPGDNDALQQLRQAVDELDEHYTVLVLSAATSWRNNRRNLAFFDALGIDALVVSGLDLTTQCGMLLNLAGGNYPPLLGVTESRMPTSLIGDFDVRSYADKLIGDDNV
jgi:flagellar biosynthesis GTPase FlhF